MVKIPCAHKSDLGLYLNIHIYSNSYIYIYSLMAAWIRSWGAGNLTSFHFMFVTSHVAGICKCVVGETLTQQQITVEIVCKHHVDQPLYKSTYLPILKAPTTCANVFCSVESVKQGLLDQQHCYNIVELLDQTFCYYLDVLLDQKFCYNVVGLLDQKFFVNIFALLDPA